VGAIEVNAGSSGFAGTAANLGTSARAASPIPGVNDGAAAPRSKKIDRTMEPMKHQGRGMLRVVGNDELDAAERQSKDLSEVSSEVATDLANYVRQRFEKAVRHRRVIAVDDELIRDMRAYNGQYDPGVLQAIQSMGGSAVALLVNQMETVIAHPEELLFEPELVVRGSTGPAAARSASRAAT